LLLLLLLLKRLEKGSVNTIVNPDSQAIKIWITRNINSLGKRLKSRFGRKTREFVAGNITLVFLAITTIMFYLLRLEAGSFVDKFPSSTPCYSFDSTFTEVN
jgi:hypothetical protein